jgi:hypothetical protein
MAKNAVVVKFLADVAGLQKGIGDVDKKLGLFGKGVKALGITLATAFSAKEIVNFSKEALKAASDLDESINKVNAVFGLSGETIKTWSENSVLSFGLSQQAALEAAGTFGNLFTAFGVGVPEAEKMSRALTELAADLASFNNTSIDQALTALRSGLSGETEPLKRFGVALNQAAIEAEALALGLINSGDELDQAAKSQAIYSIVMKQTSNAQGDFQRTSDGLANTLRTLDAAVEDAKANVGQGFVRAVDAAIGAVGGRGGLTEIIDDSGESFGDFTLGVALAIEKLEEFRDKKRSWLGPLKSIGDFAYATANQLSGGLVESTAAVIKATTLAGKAENAFAESVANADKQSRIAANNLRGQFVPASVQAAQAAKLLEDQALQTASAIRAMTGAGSTPENSRAIRQMDSFGRTLDKQSIYWDNVKQDNKDYWDSITTGAGRAGGSVKKLGDDVIKEGKKVKNFSAEIGDFTLSVAQKAAKGKKISADAIKAMTEAGQEAIQGLLDDLAKAEAQLVDTQKFIAQQTASFLGPTDVKSVQQAYAAAKSEAEQLERAAQRAIEARKQAEAGGSETDAQKARIAQLAKEEQEAIKKAADAGKEAAKGFNGFWADAQASVVAYRGELDKLRQELEKDGITQAEAKLFQDLFTLPPDQGTEIVGQLLTDTGKALVDSQQKIIEDTNKWMVVITDTFAGKNGFPAVGYTAASKMVEDLNKELRSEDTKTIVRKAVRAAVPKSVKVRVKWEYDAFVPPVPGVVGTRSNGSRTIQDIQAYERMNGSKWRERVR